MKMVMLGDGFLLGFTVRFLETSCHGRFAEKVGIEDATVNHGTSLCQKERSADSDEKNKKINK